MQFPAEAPTGAKQFITDPAIRRDRAALAGSCHGAVFAIDNPGVNGSGVPEKAVEQLFGETNINVVGNLGGRAVAYFNQCLNVIVHGMAGAEIVQSNLYN